MWNNGFRVLSSLKLRRDTQGGPPPPIYMRASCARAGCMDEVDEVDEVDEKQHGLPPSLKLCRDKKAHPTQETRVKKVELPPEMADIVIVDS